LYKLAIAVLNKVDQRNCCRT